MEYHVQIALDVMDFDGSPEGISKALQVVPTYARREGDLNEQGVRAKRNLWSLRSQAESADSDVEAHWASIRGKVEARKDAFAAIAKTNKLRITLIVHAGERFPSIIIPPSMSAFAAHVGASIDVDLYQ
jgi:hypothetical protein